MMLLKSLSRVLDFLIHQTLSGEREIRIKLLINAAFAGKSSKCGFQKILAILFLDPLPAFNFKVLSPPLPHKKTTNF